MSDVSAHFQATVGRAVALIVAGVFLASCGVAEYREAKNRRAQMDSQDLERVLAGSRSVASYRVSPSSGDRTCLVRQEASAYRANALRDRLSSVDPSVARAIMMDGDLTMSKVAFSIDANGGATLLLPSSEIYPGSETTANFNNVKVRSVGDYPIRLSLQIVGFLRDGKEFYIGWAKWPDHRAVEYSDRFDGFAAAMDECVRKMK